MLSSNQTTVIPASGRSANWPNQIVTFVHSRHNVGLGASPKGCLYRVLVLGQCFDHAADCVARGREDVRNQSCACAQQEKACGPCRIQRLQSKTRILCSLCSPRSLHRCRRRRWRWRPAVRPCCRWLSNGELFWPGDRLQVARGLALLLPVSECLSTSADDTGLRMSLNPHFLT